MGSFSDLFKSSDQPNSLGAKFRAKRLEDFEALFFKIFDKDQKIRILDVGGTDYFWKGSSIIDLPNVSITLLNLHLEESSHPSVKAITGDATDMSNFENEQFDLVFSNSVIEHLYSFDSQKKMADEVMRVGKRYFIQSPNRSFPIEAHYALPFAQKMPKSWVYFLLTKTRFSRLQRWEEKDARQYLDEIRLLSQDEMKTLFPGSELYFEKVFGLVKSFAAHNLHKA
ncbi:class I SAM-dependent methyltransferase [Algoriphagus sediminis]|uniref:Class I SAM-dependent methyltransferase n=1 Tax=Algoriphagus sediminis TaxID=3057113 RepID=A0ABT7YBK4_9BACT|nr:class I SAM-dependent methyltransferase [Algoriphagus sediminis]MDN3203831.1 class I SAM-dependent methyltransferase [Algoriphagus sediminis]